MWLPVTYHKSSRSLSSSVTTQPPLLDLCLQNGGGGGSGGTLRRCRGITWQRDYSTFNTRHTNSILPSDRRFCLTSISEQHHNALSLVTAPISVCCRVPTRLPGHFFFSFIFFSLFVPTLHCLDRHRSVCLRSSIPGAFIYSQTSSASLFFYSVNICRSSLPPPANKPV